MYGTECDFVPVYRLHRVCESISAMREIIHVINTEIHLTCTKLCVFIDDRAVPVWKNSQGDNRVCKLCNPNTHKHVTFFISAFIVLCGEISHY